MVARDFPCKKCGHLADRHFLSVCQERGLCTDCITSQFIEREDEHWHDFEGDNLKYMELQVKKKALRNE